MHCINFFHKAVAALEYIQVILIVSSKLRGCGAKTIESRANLGTGLQNHCLAKYAAKKQAILWYTL
jgi:hypothetical protein